MFLYVMMFIFISYIWTNSSYKDENRPDNCKYTFEDVFDRLNDVKEYYIKWQFFSLILFFVFGPFLLNFYHHVVVDGDRRYLFQAIFFNILYFFTWIIGTVPLYNEHKEWKILKSSILFDKETGNKLERNGVKIEELKKEIPNYEIASSLNHIVTMILTALSFVFPFLKAFIS